jgi:hypothetical protein
MRSGDSPIFLLSTVGWARELVLGSRDSAALAPFGVLILRVAEVGQRMAADLLVEASRVIHGIGETKKSWKKRQAHRWRSPAIALIPNLGLTDRRETIVGSHRRGHIDLP